MEREKLDEILKNLNSLDELEYDEMQSTLDYLSELTECPQILAEEIEKNEELNPNYFDEQVIKPFISAVEESLRLEDEDYFYDNLDECMIHLIDNDKKKEELLDKVSRFYKDKIIKSMKKYSNMSFEQYSKAPDYIKKDLSVVRHLKKNISVDELLQISPDLLNLKKSDVERFSLSEQFKLMDQGYIFTFDFSEDEINAILQEEIVNLEHYDALSSLALSDYMRSNFLKVLKKNQQYDELIPELIEYCNEETKMKILEEKPELLSRLSEEEQIKIFLQNPNKFEYMSIELQEKLKADPKYIKEVSTQEILKEIKNITTEEDIQNINETLQGISLDKLLEQISTGKYDELIEHKGLENLSDLLLVHKTRYVPQDGIIKTSKSAGALGEETFKFLGEEYTMQIPFHRETVHFSLNGEVTSHAFGNFDNREYAILIPFEKVPKESIGMAHSVDTFFDGDVEIPVGSYVLCPQAKREEIVRNTKNVIVVGYEGENVDEYANQFLDKVLGYRKEKIGQGSWGEKSEDSSENLKLKKILDKNNIINGTLHKGTKQRSQEVSRQSLDAFCIRFNMIKDKISDEKAYNEAIELLSKGLYNGGDSTQVVPLEELINDEITPHNYLFNQIERQIGIHIPDERKQEIYKQFEEGKEGIGGFDTISVSTQLTDYIIREWRLQQISDLTISELSEFDKSIFAQKYKEILNGRNRPKGAVPIDENTKVGEFHKILKDEQKNNVDIEALRINSEDISAQERKKEIPKMKGLEISKEETIDEPKTNNKNDEDWVM